MNLFLLGAIAAGCMLIALIFLRSWRQTGDRLFLMFSLSFAIEGLNRTALATTSDPSEGQPLFYLVRLASFVLILLAVLDKNLSGRRK